MQTKFQLEDFKNTSEWDESRVFIQSAYRDLSEHKSVLSEKCAPSQTPRQMKGMAPGTLVALWLHSSSYSHAWMYHLCDLEHLPNVSMSWFPHPWKAKSYFLVDITGRSSWFSWSIHYFEFLSNSQYIFHLRSGENTSSESHDGESPCGALFGFSVKERNYFSNSVAWCHSWREPTTGNKGESMQALSGHEAGRWWVAVRGRKPRFRKLLGHLGA